MSRKPKPRDLEQFSDLFTSALEDALARAIDLPFSVHFRDYMDFPTAPENVEHFAGRIANAIWSGCSEKMTDTSEESCVGIVKIVDCAVISLRRIVDDLPRDEAAQSVSARINRVADTLVEVADFIHADSSAIAQSEFLVGTTEKLDRAAVR